MLFINGKQTWEGVVEKGCGNQVFDYSTTIKIKDPKKTLNEPKPTSGLNQNVSPQCGNQGRMSDATKAISDEIDRDLFPGGTPTPGPGRLKPDTMTQKTNDDEFDIESAILRPDDAGFKTTRHDDDEPEVSRSLTRVLTHPDDDQTFEGKVEDSILEPERCKTRILRESTEGLPIPVVDDSIQIYSTRTSVDFSEGW